MNSGFWVKHRMLKKALATLVAAFFAANYVLTDAWAAIDTGKLPYETAEAPMGRFAKLDVETFSLPAHMGEIKYSHRAESGRIVVHIQDAHCNEFAQKRIAEIIGYLNKEYGVMMLNLEGGAGDYDLRVFTAITGEAIRSEVAEYFVEKGEINGAELYAINNPEKVTLWGVEDKELYITNLKVYRDSLSYRPEVAGYLQELGTCLDNLKRHIYTPELMKMDSAYGAYKSGGMEFREYLEFIISKAKEYGVGLDGFGNVRLLAGSLEQEGSVDFKKANRERDVLIEELRGGLSMNEMRELVKRTVDFKGAKISRRDFYGYLVKKAKALGIDIKKYQALSAYIEYITMYESVDRSKIMGELDSLEGAIKDKLYKNDTQRELNRLSHNLALLRNIFNITLTKTDYKFYLDNKDSFGIENYLSFIRREAPKYKMQALSGNGISKLDGYLEEISRFYTYSFERDKVFLKNMRFGESSNGPGAAVLMTGGFHTENLCDLFEKEKISYVSIIPRFTSADDYKSPYFDILAGETVSIEGMLRSVIAQAAMLQIASHLTSLGEAVRGAAGEYVFKAAVYIYAQTRAEKRVEVVGVDGKTLTAPDGRPLSFGDTDKGGVEKITIAELLSKAGYKGEVKPVAAPKAEGPAAKGPGGIADIGGKTLGLLIAAGPALLSFLQSIRGFLPAVVLIATLFVTGCADAASQMKEAAAGRAPETIRISLGNNEYAEIAIPAEVGGRKVINSSVITSILGKHIVLDLEKTQADIKALEKARGESLEKLDARIAELERTGEDAKMLAALKGARAKLAARDVRGVRVFAAVTLDGQKLNAHINGDIMSVPVDQVGKPVMKYTLAHEELHAAVRGTYGTENDPAREERTVIQIGIGTFGSMIEINFSEGADGSFGISVMSINPDLNMDSAEVREAITGALKEAWKEVNAREVKTDADKRFLDFVNKMLEREGLRFEYKDVPAGTFLEGKEGAMLISPVSPVMVVRAGMPAEAVDVGIASEGMGLVGRPAHDTFHEAGKFGEVIKDIAAEIGAKLRGDGRYDLRGAILKAGGTIKTAHGELRLELSEESGVDLPILVVIDDRFEKDHAGRGEFAVYARNEAKARHETSELGHWAFFAKTWNIADAEDMRTGLLGFKLRAWMNDPFLNAEDRARRQQFIAKKSEEYHQYGLKAEDESVTPEALIAPEPGTVTFLYRTRGNNVISVMQRGLRVHNANMDAIVPLASDNAAAAKTAYDMRYKDDTHVLVAAIPGDMAEAMEKPGAVIPPRLIKGYIERATGKFFPNPVYYQANAMSLGDAIERGLDVDFIVASEGAAGIPAEAYINERAEWDGMDKLARELGGRLSEEDVKRMVRDLIAEKIWNIGANASSLEKTYLESFVVTGIRYEAGGELKKVIRLEVATDNGPVVIALKLLRPKESTGFNQVKSVVDGEVRFSRNNDLDNAAARTQQAYFINQDISGQLSKRLDAAGIYGFTISDFILGPSIDLLEDKEKEKAYREAVKSVVDLWLSTYDPASGTGVVSSDLNGADFVLNVMPNSPLRKVVQTGVTGLMQADMQTLKDLINYWLSEELGVQPGSMAEISFASAVPEAIREFLTAKAGTLDAAKRGAIVAMPEYLYAHMGLTADEIEAFLKLDLSQQDVRELARVANDMSDRLSHKAQIASPKSVRVDRGGGAVETYSVPTAIKGELGVYRIEKFIAAGTYGMVMKAKAPDGRDVAIKILFPQSGARERVEFMREYLFMRQLDDVEGTMKAYETGVYNILGQKFHYIVQEYADGGSLHDRIGERINQGKTFTHREVVDAAQQLIRTLAEMQRRNVFNMDVKPANILISKGKLKIGDFGLAKYAPDGIVDLGEGAFEGTLIYIPRESVLSGKVKRKADIYAVGHILYEMLNGREPYSLSNEDYEKIMTPPTTPKEVRDRYKVLIDWLKERESEVEQIRDEARQSRDILKLFIAALLMENVKFVNNALTARPNVGIDTAEDALDAFEIMVARAPYLQPPASPTVSPRRTTAGTTTMTVRSLLANMFGDVSPVLDNIVRAFAIVATPIHELGHLIAAGAGVEIKWTARGLVRGEVVAETAPTARMFYGGVAANLIAAAAAALYILYAGQALSFLTTGLLMYFSAVNFASVLAEVVGATWLGRGDLFNARVARSGRESGVSDAITTAVAVPTEDITPAVPVAEAPVSGPPARIPEAAREIGVTDTKVAAAVEDILKVYDTELRGLAGDDRRAAVLAAYIYHLAKSQKVNVAALSEFAFAAALTRMGLDKGFVKEKAGLVRDLVMGGMDIVEIAAEGLPEPAPGEVTDKVSLRLSERFNEKAIPLLKAMAGIMLKSEYRDPARSDKFRGLNAGQRDVMLDELDKNMDFAIDYLNTLRRVRNMESVRGRFVELLYTRNVPVEDLLGLFESRDKLVRFLDKGGNFISDDGTNFGYGPRSDFGDVWFVMKPRFEQKFKGRGIATGKDQYENKMKLSTLIYDYEHVKKEEDEKRKDKNKPEKGEKQWDLLVKMMQLKTAMMREERIFTDRMNIEEELRDLGVLEKLGLPTDRPLNDGELKEAIELNADFFTYTDLTRYGDNSPGFLMGSMQGGFKNPQLNVAADIDMFADLACVIVPAHLKDRVLEAADKNGIPRSLIVIVDNTGPEEAFYAMRNNDVTMRSEANRKGVEGNPLSQIAINPIPYRAMQQRYFEVTARAVYNKRLPRASELRAEIAHEPGADIKTWLALRGAEKALVERTQRSPVITGLSEINIEAGELPEGKTAEDVKKMPRPWYAFGRDAFNNLRRAKKYLQERISKGEKHIDHKMLDAVEELVFGKLNEFDKQRPFRNIGVMMSDIDGTSVEVPIRIEMPTEDGGTKIEEINIQYTPHVSGDLDGKYAAINRDMREVLGMGRDAISVEEFGRDGAEKPEDFFEGVGGTEKLSGKDTELVKKLYTEGYEFGLITYPTSAEVAHMMVRLMEWFNSEIDRPGLTPEKVIELAADFQRMFVALHPYEDNNGRISRILMNYILESNGLPPAILPHKNELTSTREEWREAVKEGVRTSMEKIGSMVAERKYARAPVSEKSGQTVNSLLVNIFGGRAAWLNWGTRLLAVFSTPIHELGHLAAAWAMKVNAEWSVGRLFTGEVKVERAPPAVFLAGPAANLILAAVSAIFLIYTGQPLSSVTGLILSYVAVSNLASALAEIFGLTFGRGDLAAARKAAEAVKEVAAEAPAQEIIPVQEAPRAQGVIYAGDFYSFDSIAERIKANNPVGPVIFRALTAEQKAEVEKQLNTEAMRYLRNYIFVMDSMPEVVGQFPEDRLGMILDRSNGERLETLRSEVLKIGLDKNIRAQGIEELKGGLRNLMNIILAGRTYTDWAGILYEGPPDLTAGAHGPYYIIVNEDLPGWQQAEKHIAYLVPDAPDREVLVSLMDKAVREGLMTAETAESFRRKIVTYEEFVVANGRALPAEPVARRRETVRVTSTAEVPAAAEGEEIKIDVKMGSIPYNEISEAGKWGECMDALTRGKELLAGLSRPQLLDVLRKISGNKALNWDQLSDEVTLSYHRTGTHKHVLRVEFMSKDKKAISVLLAAKNEIKRGDMSSHELQNLKRLNGRGVPRFGGSFVGNDGRMWLLEEFIEGETISELRAKGGLTEDVKKKIVARLLQVAGDLGGMVPRDIHGGNFIVREGTGEVVMVDLGDRRIYVGGKEATARGMAFFTALLVAQLGSKDAPGANYFIFDAIAEDPSMKGKGMEFLMNVQNELMKQGSEDLGKYYYQEGRTLFPDFGATRDNIRPLVDFADLLKVGLSSYLAKAGMRRGPPAAAPVAPAAPEAVAAVEALPAMGVAQPADLAFEGIEDGWINKSESPEINTAKLAQIEELKAVLRGFLAENIGEIAVDIAPGSAKFYIKKISFAGRGATKMVLKVEAETDSGPKVFGFHAIRPVTETMVQYQKENPEEAGIMLGGVAAEILLFNRFRELDGVAKDVRRGYYRAGLELSTEDTELTLQDKQALLARGIMKEMGKDTSAELEKYGILGFTIGDFVEGDTLGVAVQKATTPEAKKELFRETIMTMARAWLLTMDNYGAGETAVGKMIWDPNGNNFVVKDASPLNSPNLEKVVHIDLGAPGSVPLALPANAAEERNTLLRTIRAFLLPELRNALNIDTKTPEGAEQARELEDEFAIGALLEGVNDYLSREKTMGAEKQKAVEAIRIMLQARLDDLAEQRKAAAMPVAGEAPRLRPVDLEAEIAKSGLSKEQADLLRKNSAEVISIHDFLRTLPAGERQEGGYSLGLTNDMGIYKALSRISGLTNWMEAYEEMFKDRMERTGEFMNRITSEGKPIVFFVPENIFDYPGVVGATRRDLEWLMAHPEQMKNVKFVFGTYTMVNGREYDNWFKTRGLKEEQKVEALSDVLRNFRDYIAEMPAAMAQVEAAKGVIGDLRQNRTDIIIMPGSDMYVSQQEAVTRDASRKLHKSYGQETLPYSYRFTDNWRENLKELLATRVKTAFAKAKEADKNPRILMYLPVSKEERAKLFEAGGVLAGLADIKDYITIVSEADIPADGVVDNVMHIVLAKALLNYERYEKGDFGAEARMGNDELGRLMKLLETMVKGDTIDFAAFAANPADLVNKILNGDILLKIKAIDFTEIADWKEAQDEVLRSL